MPPTAYELLHLLTPHSLAAPTVVAGYRTIFLLGLVSLLSLVP